MEGIDWQVKWLVEYYEKNGLRWDFDCVVIDELSSFKNHQAQRFKWLRKVRPFVKRWIGLTGTPTSNGLMDLWAEIGILDGGERLKKHWQTALEAGTPGSIKKDAEKNMENPREIELLNWYRKLTPEKQDAIRQMAKLLAE